MTPAEATSRRKTFVGLDDAAWWSFDDDKQEATAGFFVACERARGAAA
jgi:hypothetical protein